MCDKRFRTGYRPLRTAGALQAPDSWAECQAGCIAGAKQAAEKGLIFGEIRKKHTSGAKARIDLIGFIPGMNPRPTARTSFSTACKARLKLLAWSARLKSCPKKKREPEFNGQGLQHGILRPPTHRTKTETSDGWGTVSFIAGRLRRWTTDTKPWRIAACMSFLAA